MPGKTRLELTWIGKDQRSRLEPRILVEEPAKSHHATTRREGDIFDNMLIQGDNLLALKALEAEYAGKVKCVFIDPPYNTGSAFGNFYEDGLEHSLWLTLMRDRLLLLGKLLSDSGSIWITIDDNEAHYLKVLCDETFGRHNFISDAIWQKKYAPSNDSLWLSESHDHILIYAKDKTSWRPQLLQRTSAQDSLYKNPDDDPRGPWMSDNYTCAKSSDERPNLFYEVVNPNTLERILPSRSRVWAFEPATHARHVAEGRIYWGKDGKNSTPRLKKYLSELRRSGTIPQTVWTFEEVGHTQDAKREAKYIFPDDPFPTPKPERLIERIIHIATNPGDLVLDSFAGSGTTGAVASKMGRRWIMVELGDHAVTHIIPRLKKVIDGTDRGGVTEATGWQGGGGFRFFHLAPSLLATDKWGRWIISKEYNAAMLAEALCKHMGFTYAPTQDPIEYWKHGHSSERDFIYVTTASLTQDQLRAIAEDVGPDRTLLVCCKAFNARPDDFDNLTVKKIPHAILARCEWGKDDYSLQVAALPEHAEAIEPSSPPGSGRPSRRAPSSPTLFDEDA